MGGTRTPRLPGEGAEFDHAAEGVRDQGPALFQAALAAAQDQRIDLAEIGHVLPHQANGRMDALLALHLPTHTRVFLQADRVGNTGSAAV